MWESSKYGAAQCLTLGGGCQGSYNNNCWPFDLWSGTLLSAGVYGHGQLISGTWRAVSYTADFAFSVRCVLDLILLLLIQNADRFKSSASGMRALSTVLHAAVNTMAAARAQLQAQGMPPTATRTTYGQLPV